MSVHLAIWTLGVAMRDISIRDDYTQLQYIRYRQGEAVVMAVLWLLAQQSQAMPFWLVTIVPETHGSKNSNSSTFPIPSSHSANDELSSKIIYFPTHIDRRDLFMHIVRLMVRLALNNSSSPQGIQLQGESHHGDGPGFFQMKQDVACRLQ
ncbi:MAG: hypothetical protein Q9222_002132 [Ikaeria aurantiellina]